MTIVDVEDAKLPVSTVAHDERGHGLSNAYQLRSKCSGVLLTQEYALRTCQGLLGEIQCAVEERRRRAAQLVEQQVLRHAEQRRLRGGHLRRHLVTAEKLRRKNSTLTPAAGSRSAGRWRGGVSRRVHALC